MHCDLIRVYSHRMQYVALRCSALRRYCHSASAVEVDTMCRVATWHDMKWRAAPHEEHRKVTGRRPPGLYIQILTVGVCREYQLRGSWALKSYRNSWHAQCLSRRFSNVDTLGALTTSSGNLLHHPATLTANQHFLQFRCDCSRYNFQVWPLVLG